MGIISSTLREAYFSLRALASEIYESNSDFNDVLSRISSSPGIPVPHPTEPFWLADPPFPELVDVRSPEGLCEKADVVIIGSGITGASVARAVLQEGEKLGVGVKVVMLEARGVCSGATGRNGGNVKVSPWEVVRALKSKGIMGERARKIVDFQKRHLGILLELCKAKGIEAAELREVETVDLFVDREGLEEAKRCVKELGEEKGTEDVDWRLRVWGGEEAREKFHTSNHVVGAISYQAGALWPYRLVTSILSNLLSTYPKSFSIETYTPVESISIGTDLDAPFCVNTSRGDIKASHVIHAANGHSAALIPGLLGKIFPVRGQMTAQRPGKSFPQRGGSMSWSIIHKKSGLEYMTQRPGLPDGGTGKGGELMLGGALLQSGGRGLDEIGVSNDAEVNFNVGTYLGGVLPMLFGAKYWGADADTGRVKSMWTGIMGFTVDMMPFVGRLESGITGRKVLKRKSSDDKGTELVEPGEWIAAGYNGEGMVNAWLCGVAVGLMVLGREGVDLEAEPGMPGGQATDWLPAEYLISSERLAKSSIYELVSMV